MAATNHFLHGMLDGAILGIDAGFRAQEAKAREAKVVPIRPAQAVPSAPAGQPIAAALVAELAQGLVAAFEQLRQERDALAAQLEAARQEEAAEAEPADTPPQLGDLRGWDVQIIGHDGAGQVQRLQLTNGAQTWILAVLGRDGDGNIQTTKLTRPDGSGGWTAMVERDPNGEWAGAKIVPVETKAKP